MRFEYIISTYDYARVLKQIKELPITKDYLRIYGSPVKGSDAVKRGKMIIIGENKCVTMNFGKGIKKLIPYLENIKKRLIAHV